MEAARAYLGIRWRHQGRTDQGLDCVGLVVRVARDLGVSEYDLKGYPRLPLFGSFVGHFADNLVEVSLADARPGDVLLFADTSYPCHCGFMSERLGARYFVHASAAYRKVVETPYQGEWQLRARLAFAIPGIED